MQNADHFLYSMRKSDRTAFFKQHFTNLLSLQYLIESNIKILNMPKHPTNCHWFPLTPTSFNQWSLLYLILSHVRNWTASPKLRELDFAFVLRAEADEFDDEGCSTIWTLCSSTPGHTQSMSEAQTSVALVQKHFWKSRKRGCFQRLMTTCESYLTRHSE